MKNLSLCIAILGLAGLSAFAQQQVLFSGTGLASQTRLIWDNWSLLAPKPDASNTVAFLWTSASATPLVETQTGYFASPTNPVTTPFNVSLPPWTAILTDPNYHLATNGTSLVMTPTSTVGNYSYNSGTSFTLAGAPASGNISIYVIAFPDLYANPFLAAASNAAVGWSNPFSYTLGTPTSAAIAFSSSTPLNLLAFGVDTVPEPTTLALLGLASASLLIFRRRKS